MSFRVIVRPPCHREGQGTFQPTAGGDEALIIQSGEQLRRILRIPPERDDATIALL
jgi:hypothetical protein